jgi:hypothetical protein
MLVMSIYIYKNTGYMDETRTLLNIQLRVGVVQDEADGSEKVGLARAIASHNNVAARAQRVDDYLVPVGLETRDGQLRAVRCDIGVKVWYLLDVHRMVMV